MRRASDEVFGAGDEVRTCDLQNGNLALYQLSYTRVLLTIILNIRRRYVKERTLRTPRLNAFSSIFTYLFKSSSRIFLRSGHV